VAIPLAVFYGVVLAFGLEAALGAALGWAYLAVAVRLVRRTRPPMLLLVATAMSTVKVAITFAPTPPRPTSSSRP
jgi:drug/metabolite transporter (DMT)-like permease